MATTRSRKRTAAGKRSSPASAGPSRKPAPASTSAPATPPAGPAGLAATHSREATPTIETMPADASADGAPGTDAAPGGDLTAGDVDAAQISAATADAGPQPFKKGELLDAVKAGSSLSRNELKGVVEAVLEQVGQALDADREVVLPPLGKISIKKRKPAPNGDILTARVKRHGPTPAPRDPTRDAG